MSIPPDAKKCLDELKEYVKSFLEGNRIGEDIYKTIDKHLFSLACYMRRDDKGTIGRNSAVTNAILNGVRDIRKTLDGTKSPEIKNLSNVLYWWLTKHMGRLARYTNVSSKNCGDKADPKKNLKEEMPAYMLEAITKEKPAHPKYGNLRY